MPTTASGRRTSTRTEDDDEDDADTLAYVNLDDESVVEVSIEGGRPKVHRVTSAIHCNTAVNPRSVEAQVQGASLMGIGMTIDGAEITLVDGEVQQSNFDTYKVARITDMPPIDVHIVPSTDAPTGVGEPGLPPIAPAIANAVFALTGKPVRSLPIGKV